MKPTFTLLELVLVAGVVAVLATVAMPNYVDARLRAQTADVQVELNAVTSALLRYRVDTNAFPQVATYSHAALGRLERTEFLNFTPIDKFKSIFPDEYRRSSFYLDYREVNLGYTSNGISPAGVSAPISGPRAMYVGSVGPDGFQEFHNMFEMYIPTHYSTSNGLRSNGEIFKIIRNP